MRSIIRRMAATFGAVLLATVPLIGVVGVAPASAVTDELTASYAEPYARFSTLVRADQEYRQTFQAAVTGDLTRTRILLRSEYANYPSGGIPASVSVYNLNADNTLGALVDSGSGTITGSAWPLPTTDFATFTGGQTLTAGNNYALVVRSQITGFASSFYAEMTGGTYAYGRGYVCTVGTEDCSTNYWSTWFQVYVSTVVPDTTAPMVDLSVAPYPVLQGHPATATFSAVDLESDIIEMTCEPSFTVDTTVLGEHSITCGATSAGGSSEASITYTVVDSTPPVVNLTVAPDPVLQGLPATATFSAVDLESDITEMTCEPSFAVDTTILGEHSITCGATSAGGSSEASITYTVVDSTPPVVNLTVAPDPVLQGLPATATFSATDVESDITEMTCEPSFVVDTSTVGTFTITCGATSTGGSSEASDTYTVLSPAQGVADLRDDVVADVPAKTASPLVSLLNGAAKSLAKGDTTGAIDKLTSFIAMVDAQAGKKIPTDVAAELMSEAEMLIDSIEASSS